MSVMRIGNVEILMIGLLCLVPLLIAIVAVVVILMMRRRRPAGELPAGGEPSALDILKARYAQGEITREQYEEMRRDLE